MHPMEPDPKEPIYLDDRQVSEMEKLVRPVFEAATPEDRYHRVNDFYRTLTSRKTRPDLLRRLVNLALAPVNERRTVVIGQPVVPDDLEDKASLLSLPNELIDRIFDHLPREMGCFPALRVCRRFLHIGLRHVLHRDVFTFTSAEYDYTFSGSSRRVLRPMRPNLPDHVQLSVSRQPNRRKFETNGRTLLDTIIKSHCAFAFDPMAFITKIHIVFHLPELRLYARLPRVPTRSGLTRRERWLYLMTDHTRDQAIERLLSEVPHQRAELHFGCLRVLPLAFKNLRLVQLSFYRRELSWYPADYGFAYAVWIGRYLHIKIKKIVKTVEFPKEWELISDVLHKIIDEGFDL